VIDDDVRLRSVLSNLLLLWGYQAETAEDGVAALEKVSAFKPCVILRDLRMPRMDGLKLLKEIRDKVDGICIIMYSGKSTFEEEQEAASLGISSFLSSR
jgi:DNA-binding NtrC family response regulator